jgi:hypothetical protein
VVFDDFSCYKNLHASQIISLSFRLLDTLEGYLS